MLSSFNFKLLSHPNRLLKDHLTFVLQNGRLFYQNISLTKEQQQLFDLCLILHDLGKATTFFQKYLQVQEAKEKRTISIQESRKEIHKLGYRKNHARISAIWAYWLSEQKFHCKKLASIAFMAVLNHHGHLGNFKETLSYPLAKHHQELLEMSENLNYEEFSEILKINGFLFEDFNHSYFETNLKLFKHYTYSRKTVKKICKDLGENDFYLTSFLFSVLLSADKGECIFRGQVYQRPHDWFPKELVDLYKKNQIFNPSLRKKQNERLNQQREAIYQSISNKIGTLDLNSERFYSINLPTGAGKTLAVINAANLMVQQESFLKKIIYCLPFTSVIDQTAQIFEKILKENNRTCISENNVKEVSSSDLLVNHHLTELFYREQTDQDEFNFYQDYRGEYLIHQFESNFNVTTFYQFLYGIFTRKNREIRKLQSFANSVIILDEVQNIPPHYWKLIRVVLQQLSKKLNCVFILVTATMPLIFSESKGEIIELVDNKEAFFKEMKRIQLETQLLNENLTLLDFGQLLLEDVQKNPKKSFLVILNTKNCCEMIFKNLKENGLEPIYLSTNLPPFERLKRIQHIQKETKAQKPLVVVTTQLVEAGVDIDLDIVYRDIAPLDSIFQSAGRCNRNSLHSKGNVKIVSLVNDQDKERSFASYIYNKILLDVTKKLLEKNEIYEESDFYYLSKSYFEELTKKLNLSDSDSILKEMESLNYLKAFDRKENTKAFQLIEEKLYTVPAYLNFTKESKALHEKFLEIQKQEFSDPFEKKFRIKQHLRKMSQFIVHLPKKYLEETETDFVVISEERAEFEYDEDLGLILQEQLTF